VLLVSYILHGAVSCLELTVGWDCNLIRFQSISCTSAALHAIVVQRRPVKQKLHMCVA